MEASEKEDRPRLHSVGGKGWKDQNKPVYSLFANFSLHSVCIN